MAYSLCRFWPIGDDMGPLGQKSKSLAPSATSLLLWILIHEPLVILILFLQNGVKISPLQLQRIGWLSMNICHTAFCTEFPFPGDLFLGFEINWLPLFLDFTLCFLPVASPRSPLSCFSSRLCVPSRQGLLFSVPLDCVYFRGWAHSRLLTNPYWSLHKASFLPHYIFIGCLHAIYFNSLWRVGTIWCISYVSPNPAPLTWFPAQ